MSASDVFKKCQGFSFWEITYPPGATYGPRIQNGLQLLVSHNEVIEVEAEDRTMRLEAGDAGLLLPGRSEFFQFGKTQKHHMSWCHVAAGPELMRHRAALHELPLKVPFNATMNAIMQLGIGLNRRAWPNPTPVIDSLGLALLLEWMNSGVPSGSHVPLPKPLEKAETWMRDHLEETVDVPQIARAVGLSPRHLARLWKIHFQERILDRLWKLRIERAGGLLTSSGLGVAEIAYQCGFQSPFHFSRKIRTHFGCSPKELRSRSYGQEKDK